MNASHPREHVEYEPENRGEEQYCIKCVHLFHGNRKSSSHKDTKQSQDANKW